MFCRIGPRIIMRLQGTLGMQDPVFELPRIYLPRTPLNKGMDKGRGSYSSPGPRCRAPIVVLWLSLRVFFGHDALTMVLGPERARLLAGGLYHLPNRVDHELGLL